MNCAHACSCCNNKSIPTPAGDQRCSGIYVNIGPNIQLQYDIPTELSAQLGPNGKLVLVQPTQAILKIGTWIKFGLNIQCIVGNRFGFSESYNSKKFPKPNTESMISVILEAGTIVNCGLGPQTLEQDLVVKLPARHRVLLPAGTLYWESPRNNFGENNTIEEFKKECPVFLYA